MGCLKASYGLSFHLPETGNSLGNGLQINVPLPCPWIPYHTHAYIYTQIHKHVQTHAHTQSACTQSMLPSLFCLFQSWHPVHHGFTYCPCCCHLVMPDLDTSLGALCMLQYGHKICYLKIHPCRLNAPICDYFTYINVALERTWSSVRVLPCLPNSSDSNSIECLQDQPDHVRSMTAPPAAVGCIAVSIAPDTCDNLAGPHLPGHSKIV